MKNEETKEFTQVIDLTDLNNLPELIDLGDEDDRPMRRKISELRKIGVIYISIGKRKYKRIEKCSRSQINDYIFRQIHSMQTQYFNTLLPIKKYMTKEQLEFLYEGGLFNEEVK